MFAERLAFELQTYFRSSLLSLRNFRRERSDNPKYVCSPQATEWWNRVEYNSYVICKKLGVIRWLDCPCEIIWKLHFNCPNNSCLFFFCLLPSSSFLSSFMLFSYLVSPLPVLSFQEAKMFRSWCPCKIFQPLILIAPLIDVFFVFLCKKFLAISHNFELRAFIFVRAVLSSVHASLP